VAVSHLALTDFRCFPSYQVALATSGVTVLRGPNGSGKSSVLEAVAWLAAGRSWRTATKDVLVRHGAERAVIRAEVVARGRRVRVEGVVPVRGPTRVWLNSQPTARRADVADVLRVVVFSPDDLALVAGGPSGRRQLLDEVLGTLQPRYEAVVHEVERALRQRGALLQQLGLRPDDAGLATLEVWDDRLSRVGEALVRARRGLVARLAPLVSAEHDRLTGGGPRLELTYEQSWTGPLAEALASHRAIDLRRGTTGVGPHRDELTISLGGRPARTHASQGEQRSVALALRLAVHRLYSATGGPTPVLLLDDVFSELDPKRAHALAEQLPDGQVLLSTASDGPAPAAVAAMLDVRGGAVVGIGAR
jgi:DNA replication and repair protein RecF